MSQKFLNGIDMQSTPINNVPDAVSAQQPATFAQLNAAIEGRRWKDPVRVASTGNLTLSGTQTIDGVAVIAGDRVLAKNQSTASQNGIYVVAAGSWSRSTDADSSTEIYQATMMVSEGTANAELQFTCSTNNPIILNTTGLTFVQVGGSGASYTQGNGILISGGVISVDPAVTARKVGVDFGNGSATSFTINHALNTTDCVCEIRETGGAKQKVDADVVFTDANNVQITVAVAPTTGQYRATIIG